MEKFVIASGKIKYGKYTIGPLDGVYCYYQEHRPGLTVYKAPGARVDIVTGILGTSPQVLGIECKTPKDLFNSWKARRLARQIYELEQAVDVPAIMMMGEIGPNGLMGYGSDGKRHYWSYDTLELLWRDIVAFQGRGGLFLPGPADPADVASWVKLYAGALTDLGLRRVVAGRDIPPGDREMSPGWWLRRLPGWGPETAKKMMQQFGSVAAVIDNAYNETALREAGANYPQVKTLQAALSEVWPK